MANIFDATHPDPITTISQKLVTILKASNNFMSLAGKIIDMTSPKFERFQTEVMDADLPQITIVQGACDFDPFGPNSRAASFHQTFKFVLVMDNLQSPPLNELKMTLMGALANSGPELGLSGLVYRWQVRGAKDDPFGPQEWTRNTVRFFGFINIDVEFYLPNELLQQIGR